MHGAKEKVDHSTAGAQEAVVTYGLPLGQILAYVIAGHHNGLMDGNLGDEVNLLNRLKKKDLPNYNAYKDEISLPTLSRDCFTLKFSKDPFDIGFSLSFYIRMLYSCLVDSDYLDTEKFMGAERFIKRGTPLKLTKLAEKLEIALEEKCKNAVDSIINKERQSILGECREAANWEQGLFTLTVPTGGGKTLSSLSFAINHAIKYGKERIIYVIPYTSIIEQNAEVFRDILGDEAVLEHHSNFEYAEGSFDNWDEQDQKHKLATENWDRPIIVTTAVQFFESLFSCKSSKCRKLHNIANSVVILDEAQMLPVDYLKPCLYAISELVRNYSTSAVLCTATQPAIQEHLPFNIRTKEIISDVEKLQNVFKRVEVENIGTLTDQEVIEKLLKESQVLCVVNTRKHAALLYEALKNRAAEYDGLYHLSARMCPAHRTNVLYDIRIRLKQGEVCRVISTQLIEAGVDIDFPTVYRSAAGLDSITQAAGRCNREGRLFKGQAFIFWPEKHGLPKHGQFELCANIMNRNTQRHPENVLCLEAITEYFEELYDWQSDRLDSKGILRACNETVDRLLFPFVRIAHDFKLIEKEMVSLIVPYDDEVSRIRKEIEHHPYPGVFARRLQKYTVQIYPYEFEALKKAGVIGRTRVGELFWFIEDSNYYDDASGLKDAMEVIKNPEVYIF